MGNRAQNRITLTLEGHKIPGRQFITGINALFKLINAVSDAVMDTRGAIDWVVSVEPGSVIVHFDPESPAADQVPKAIEAISDGLARLEDGWENRPSYFNDDALRSSQNLFLLSTQKISSRVLADSTSLVTVVLPFVNFRDEYIVTRNTLTSSTLVFFPCSLLQLSVTSFENFPIIFGVLHCSIASKRRHGVVTDGLFSLLVGGVSVHINTNHMIRIAEVLVYMTHLMSSP